MRAVAAIGSTWVALTCAVLGIEVLGVRVLHLVNLAFEVHLDWCALSGLVAFSAFAVVIHSLGGPTTPSVRTLFVVAMITLIWWCSTLFLLMVVHSLFGYGF